MTDRSFADTEARLRSALELLAARHQPDAEGHWPSSHRRGGRGERRDRPQSGRWWLAAASLVVVIAGVVALTIVQRPGDVVAPTGTASPSTLPPVTTTVPPDTSPSVGEVDGLRFDRPFDGPTVARLDPAPASPEIAYELVGNDHLMFGWEAVETVWVLDDGELIGSLMVVDENLPWAIASEGHAITELDGVEAVVDDDAGFRVVLRRGDGIRRIQAAGDGPSDADRMADAVRLAEVIGVDPVAASLPTEQFQLRTASTFGTTFVRYGDAGDGSDTIDVALSRFDETPSSDELRWIATLLAQGNQPTQLDANTFTATLDTGQRALLELVSPTDAVSVLAPAGTDVSVLRDSLTFESVDDSVITVETIDTGMEATDVVARGAAGWGEWQLARSPDGTCRSVTVARWTAGELTADISGGGGCQDDAPLSPAICASVAPGEVLVIVPATDAAVVEVSVDGQPARRPAVANGEGAAFALVDGVPTGPDPVRVTVEGRDIACSPH